MKYILSLCVLYFSGQVVRIVHNSTEISQTQGAIIIAVILLAVALTALMWVQWRKSK